jgi:hypothetical protein
MKDGGCTIQSVGGVTGIMLSFLLTQARCPDTQPLMELLDSFSHHLAHLLEDGASNDATLQTSLEQKYSRNLLAPIKETHAPELSVPFPQLAQSVFMVLIATSDLRSSTW